MLDFQKKIAVVALRFFPEVRVLEKLGARCRPHSPSCTIERNLEKVKEMAIKSEDHPRFWAVPNHPRSGLDGSWTTDIQRELLMLRQGCSIVAPQFPWLALNYSCGEYESS